MERKITSSVGAETERMRPSQPWKWRKSFRDKAIRMCKDPDLGKNPTCLKN